MIAETSLYYFSPTGGTKKVGLTVCQGISKVVKEIDLGKWDGHIEQLTDGLVVVAIPVFGGRIPALAVEKLRMLDGNGLYAVSLVVYGNRAYEDALLELNQTLTERGFEILASGAFIAQHSMAPEVAQGRPDEQDVAELKEFSQKVLDKLANNLHTIVTVPGNFPYKEGMQVPASPITLSTCDLCGTCEMTCPTKAIHIGENKAVATITEQCILCMACVAACPKNARILPPPMKERTEQMLGALKSVRRENEIFL